MRDNKPRARLRLGVATGSFSVFVVWQELRGSLGYPWSGRCRVMAVEPFSSISSTGLINAIDAETAPLLRCGAKVEANLAAIFYEAEQGNLRSISTSGIAQFQGSDVTRVDI